MGASDIISEVPIKPSNKLKSLGFSIDYLGISYTLKSHSKTIEILSQRKEIIMNEKFKFTKIPSNHKYYKGPCFSTKGLRIYTSLRMETRPVKLEIYGTAFNQYHIDELIDLCDQLEKKLYLDEPIISKADLALDVLNLPIKKNASNFKCSFKELQIYSKDNQLTGIIFGKRTSNQIRIYNKTLQLKKSNLLPSNLYPALNAQDTIWRIEASMKGQWYRSRGIDSPLCLKENSHQIMKTILTKTIYLKGRNGKTSDKWIKLRNNLSPLDPIPTIKKIKRFNERHNISMLAGYLSSLAIHKGMDNPIEAIQYALSKDSFIFHFDRSFLRKLNS